MFALRRGRWKLIEGLGSGGFTAPRRVEPEGDAPPGQLYDLAADPGETNDVYLEHPDVVAELTRWLDAIRAGRDPAHEAMHAPAHEPAKAGEPDEDA